MLMARRTSVLWVAFVPPRLLAAGETFGAVEMRELEPRRQPDLGQLAAIKYLSIACAIRGRLDDNMADHGQPYTAACASCDCADHVAFEPCAPEQSKQADQSRGVEKDQARRPRKSWLQVKRVVSVDDPALTENGFVVQPDELSRGARLPIGVRQVIEAIKVNGRQSVCALDGGSQGRFSAT